MNTKVNQKEKMLLAIDAWKKSGLKQKEFCRQHGITHSVFYYWLAKSKVNKSNSFIPLNAPYSLKIKSNSYVEVIGINGNIVRFYESFTSELLSLILKG